MTITVGQILQAARETGFPASDKTQVIFTSAESLTVPVPGAWGYGKEEIRQWEMVLDAYPEITAMGYNSTVDVLTVRLELGRQRDQTRQGCYEVDELVIMVLREHPRNLEMLGWGIFQTFGRRVSMSELVHALRRLEVQGRARRVSLSEGGGREGEPLGNWWALPKSRG